MNILEKNSLSFNYIEIYNKYISSQPKDKEKIDRALHQLRTELNIEFLNSITHVNVIGIDNNPLNVYLTGRLIWNSEKISNMKIENCMSLLKLTLDNNCLKNSFISCMKHNLLNTVLMDYTELNKYITSILKENNKINN